ncbi:efflux pump antibiotic resistance protein [Penicillium malachiteum]|uniref:efflux pump antibiotic resistance protein n=1 Tax=Penicillium malachiteum TaxID=1324776 RepID=UPI002548D2E5|nr:efflux pump antibiotic resistance protein [Penicillium malachiteum]KAJ5714411.1 efflux pump antibiotic resistance protein [Penicillium malachiteum]
MGWATPDDAPRAAGARIGGQSGGGEVELQISLDSTMGSNADEACLSHTTAAVKSGQELGCSTETCSLLAKPENENRYPSRWQALLVTISLCLTTFCVALDGTILATAIPRITDEFHSLWDVGWYSSSYMFAMTATQMMWGKFYTILPAKCVFLWSLSIFEIGSLICGLAPSSLVLITGRCIAGIGAGGLNAGDIVIVTNTIPLRIRPIYLGLIQCIHGVVSVGGPLLGGVLTDHVSWRWCFYINLPLGFVTLISIFLLLSSNKPPLSHLSRKEKVQSMDPLGSVFLIPGIVTLLLALQWGGSQYAWTDWRITLLFALSAVLLTIFLRVQVWAKDRATLPIRLICNRNMLGILWYAFYNSGALIIFTYYLPIWFQVVNGISATQSGLMSLPTELGYVVSSLVGGVLVTLVGYYTPFLIVSSMGSAIGAGLLSTLHPSSGLGPILGYQVVLSASVGIGAQSANLVPQVAVTPEDTTMAITTFVVIQSLCNSVSLPLAQSVFHNRLLHNLRVDAPSVDPLIVEMYTTRLRQILPPRLLRIVLEAYSRSITQTFYVGVAMCALSFFGSASLDWESVCEERPVE